jgi:pimeloyl-ACP methyl ester carboxylesterase
MALWAAILASSPLSGQYSEFTFYSPLAEDWYRAAESFEWTSTTENNNGQTVQVSYRTFGSRSNPAIVLLHGYPTSSFDFREMIEFLQDDYFVATLDFPGFGFSDKPQGDYSYMLRDDARLVDHYVKDILGLTRFALFTHDRGVSVGLAFLENYLANDSKPYVVTYHFLSNSGMFLPLAKLGAGQTVLLDPVRGQRNEPEEVAKVVRLALSGGVPSKEEEGSFMRSYSRTRSSPAAAVFVGHSDIEEMVFPGAVEYTPAGYVIPR